MPNKNISKVNLARRRRHADNQEKYAREKTETDKRCCRWIPRSKVEDFDKNLTRLRKKWAS